MERREDFVSRKCIEKAVLQFSTPLPKKERGTYPLLIANLLNACMGYPKS